ncbi:hypothetical protein AN640_04355 [Candidatus Epulonipiscium fishelsonii]|uniref:Uncharacterized protein n=1 Tax=Candidatus Epulonipiscium fishelsonii TaxID=77094 RepID=A0ACC8XIW6_9FIRM|nr:hypothetical protein AN640_04355 [Epulopiscium sp. SCG-D08WGA-EpuloA1]OON97946.1 MAG: hypothetical protein ATN32_05070 [Epulopiscium sp. AS2M-Bin002]
MTVFRKLGQFKRRFARKKKVAKKYNARKIGEIKKRSKWRKKRFIKNMKKSTKKTNKKFKKRIKEKIKSMLKKRNEVYKEKKAMLPSAEDTMNSRKETKKTKDLLSKRRLASSNNEPISMSTHINAPSKIK